MKEPYLSYENSKKRLVILRRLSRESEVREMAPPEKEMTMEESDEDPG
jgi:hypothetical protein